MDDRPNKNPGVSPHLQSRSYDGIDFIAYLWALYGFCQTAVRGGCWEPSTKRDTIKPSAHARFSGY